MSKATSTINGHTVRIVEVHDFPFELHTQDIEFWGNAATHTVYTVVSEGHTYYGHLVRSTYTNETTGKVSTYFRTMRNGQGRLSTGIKSKAAALKKLLGS